MFYIANCVSWFVLMIFIGVEVIILILTERFMVFFLLCGTGYICLLFVCLYNIRLIYFSLEIITLFFC